MISINKTPKAVALATSLITLTACAPMQQPWDGQTYAGGGQQQQQPYGAQQPYGNQQPYGYGNQQPYGSQQPYGYGNQQGYGNQSASPMSSVLGTAAELALIKILTGQLGITQQQAMGGAGSIFQIAQQRLQPNDFSLLSTAIPDMDQYLAAAPQQMGTGDPNDTGLWGAASSLIALTSSFQSLGMNADMVGRFVPVLLQYVEQKGGSSTMALLQNALY